MRKFFWGSLLVIVLLVLAACAPGAAPAAPAAEATEPAAEEAAAEATEPAAEEAAAEATEPAAEEAAADEEITIVVSMKGPGAGNPFWAAVEAGAVAKGEELGVNVIVMAPP